jgi:hypothetical protein
MTSESKLQQDCFVWFWNTYPNLHGTMWMVYNNPKNAFIGAILVAMGLVKGVSDLQWLNRGKFYGIELKTETGRQSKAQAQWQKAIEAQGGEYIIIRSFDEFRTFVETTLSK